MKYFFQVFVKISSSPSIKFIKIDKTPTSGTKGCIHQIGTLGRFCIVVALERENYFIRKLNTFNKGINRQI